MSKGSSQRPTDTLAFQTNYDAIFGKKKEPLPHLKRTLCMECHEGYYAEPTIYGGWHGTLHCDNCNHEVRGQ